MDKPPVPQIPFDPTTLQPVYQYASRAQYGAPVTGSGPGGTSLPGNFALPSGGETTPTPRHWAMFVIIAGAVLAWFLWPRKRLRRKFRGGF